MINIMYIYFALSFFLMNGFFKNTIKRWPILKSDYPLTYLWLCLIYNIATGCFFAFLCFVNNYQLDDYHIVISNTALILGVLPSIMLFNILYLYKCSKYILEDPDALLFINPNLVYAIIPSLIAMLPFSFTSLEQSHYGSLSWLTTLHTIMQIMDWPIVHYVIVIGIVVSCVTLLFVNKVPDFTKRFVGLVLALFLSHICAY